MAKSLPPLTWFRAFEAAARKLSFTAAAAEIGMTQSAVSQQIKALETRLGVALFVRHARALSLTDDGRRLLPQVGAALETLAAAAGAFEVGTSRRVLTIACSVSVTQWIIAPHLAEFTAIAPDVRLRLLSTIWPDDFNAVRADVGIPFGSRAQVGSGGILLEPNRLVALKAKGLAGDIDSLPLIESVGTSDGWRIWSDTLGGDMQPEVFVDSYGAALTMAAHGNGVALVSEMLAQHALDTGQVEIAHPARMPCKEGYYLRFNDAEPCAKLFADWLLRRIGHSTHGQGGGA